MTSSVAAWVAASLCGVALLLWRRPGPPPLVARPELSASRSIAARWAGVRGRRRRREARLALSERALEACTVMADELRAGRSPETALGLAARWCPELLPVVSAHELGADVPAALRRTGVEELAYVAAAWQVAHRSGRGLGDALARVADSLRASRATRRVVASELASARATARLLVALPVVAMVASAVGGGRPWEFFLTSLAGHLCLGLGLLLAWAGLRWIDYIADDVERSA